MIKTKFPKSPQQDNFGSSIEILSKQLNNQTVERITPKRIKHTKIQLHKWHCWYCTGSAVMIDFPYAFGGEAVMDSLLQRLKEAGLPENCNVGIIAASNFSLPC